MEQEGSNSTDDEDGNQNSSHSTEGGGQPDKEGRQQEGQPGGEQGVVTSARGIGREGHEAPAQQEYCECQRIYLEAQNSKKTLHLLAIGLMDQNGADLFSFDNEPWSKLPKTSMRPQNVEYLREINRRAMLYNVQPRPRPSNWKRPRIMTWLHDNPVREGDCQAFLSAEVEKLRNILHRLQEQAAESAPTTSKWRGNVPYLRVIMCLTDDHVKHLFINRANVRTRQEVDGRNSENR
jgi:hypothetical protein